MCGARFGGGERKAVKKKGREVWRVLLKCNTYLFIKVARQLLLLPSRSELASSDEQ
jgi:hypothetical protein